MVPFSYATSTPQTRDLAVDATSLRSHAVACLFLQSLTQSSHIVDCSTFFMRCWAKRRAVINHSFRQPLPLWWVVLLLFTAHFTHAHLAELPPQDPWIWEVWIYSIAFTDGCTKKYLLSLAVPKGFAEAKTVDPPTPSIKMLAYFYDKKFLRTLHLGEGENNCQGICMNCLNSVLLRNLGINRI